MTRGSLSPPEDSEDDGMYNRLDEVLSPPSPLVEYDQVWIYGLINARNVLTHEKLYS